MNKSILNSIFGILATLACANQALATLPPPPLCQNFSGTLFLQHDGTSENPACQILQRTDTRVYFPDLLLTNNFNFRFLYALGVPGTCFIGTITGTLDGQPVIGTSYSGQTTNNFPDLRSFGKFAFSAATTLVLNKKIGPNPNDQLPLGNIYFRDTGFLTFGPEFPDNPLDVEANEQLVVIGASGLFWGIKGTLRIDGYELAPSGAALTGQFCR